MSGSAIPPGVVQAPTPGAIAYLAWWREFEHGHGYDHQAFLALPERHRLAWEAAAEAAWPHDPANEARAGEREQCARLLEIAWGVIANAGWDDCAKSPGWQEAAVRWRDAYHAYLDDLPVPFHKEEVSDGAQ